MVVFSFRSLLLDDKVDGDWALRTAFAILFKNGGDGLLNADRIHNGSAAVAGAAAAAGAAIECGSDGGSDPRRGGSLLIPVRHLRNRLRELGRIGIHDDEMTRFLSAVAAADSAAGRGDQGALGMVVGAESFLRLDHVLSVLRIQSIFSFPHLPRQSAVARVSAAAAASAPPAASPSSPLGKPSLSTTSRPLAPTSAMMPATAALRLYRASGGMLHRRSMGARALAASAANHGGGAGESTAAGVAAAEFVGT